MFIVISFLSVIDLEENVFLSFKFFCLMLLLSIGRFGSLEKLWGKLIKFVFLFDFLFFWVIGFFKFLGSWIVWGILLIWDEDFWKLEGGFLDWFWLKDVLECVLF